MKTFWLHHVNALASAKFKHERGAQFQSAAINSLSNYESQRPFRLTADGRYSEHAWGIEVFRNLPIEVMLNVGDAVHNWRSALDHCAFTFWSLDNSENLRSNLRSNDVYFPFAAKRRDFRAQIEKMALLDDATEIFNSFEAFIGGQGDTLFHLSKADNTDKHRLIPAAHISITIRDLFIRSLEDHWEPVEEHLAPVWIGLDSNLQSTTLKNRQGDQIFGYYNFQPMKAYLQRYIDDKLSKMEISVNLAENVPKLGHDFGESLRGSLSAFRQATWNVIDKLQILIYQRIESQQK